MFPSNTYLKVLRYLNVTIANAEIVQKALDDAETNSELEVEITEILTQIADLETALRAERSSPNSAMTRADVVEWQPGARSKGMTVALNVLKQQLANLLGLTWNRPPSGIVGGITTITTHPY